MVPEAREVRLKPKERVVLEARCRAPTPPQRDVSRARIVLLAAVGRSTRSIAIEVGVQPRIVSNWRRRFAEEGLAGLDERPRPGKAVCGFAKMLDGRPPWWWSARLNKIASAGRDRSSGPLDRRAGRCMG